jgi:aspartyl-tRNA(Asn)/glutamyl-tRNA(Gln) amidotransferase subunit B
VERVLAANASVVEAIRGGKTGSENYLVGQAMKETRGRANPEVVRRLIRQKIGLE